MDMKFWWPQCEAIIATLYAYEATGDPKYLEMHKQINEYTYARFPDKEYGEWFGYFHYDGSSRSRQRETCTKVRSIFPGCF
mgnify:FL=1